MDNDKGTILIADDSKLVRESVEAFLEMVFPEYIVSSFKDGISVQNRLEEELKSPGDVRLLITDNEMPGITGSELIEMYSGKVSFPIVLQYGGVPKIGEEAVKNGAFGYLKKSYSLDRFTDLIGRALKEI